MNGFGSQGLHEKQSHAVSARGRERDVVVRTALDHGVLGPRTELITERKARQERLTRHGRSRGLDDTAYICI